jgi:hypothetical protein
MVAALGAGVIAAANPMPVSSGWEFGLKSKTHYLING